MHTWIYITANLMMGGGDQLLLAHARALHRSHHRIVLWSLEPFDPDSRGVRELEALGVQVRRLPYILRLLMTLLTTALCPCMAVAALLLGSRILRRCLNMTLPLSVTSWRARYTAGMRLLASYLYRPFLLAALRWHLRRGRVSAVHVFHAVALHAVRQVIVRASIPTVYTEISSPLGYGVWVPDIGDILPRLDTVIVPSETIGALIESRAKGPVRLYVLPFTTDTKGLDRISTPSGNPSPSFGIIGRLSAEKGHSDLLEATAIIHREVPTAQLIIAGDGPLRKDLEAQAERLALGSCVKFLGRFGQLVDVLRQLDVAVLSSTIEGMPLTILEAMAAGKPAVATGVGAIPDLITDGVTGYVVPPGDVGLLAERVVLLLQDVELRTAMGEAARRAYQERFEDGVTLRKTLRFCDYLLGIDGPDQAISRNQAAVTEILS